MKRLRGLCIGAGYFSQFHLDAWRRLPDVQIVAVCDRDTEKARRAAEPYGIAAWCSDAHEALARFDVDFVDIITPPDSHLELVEAAARQGCDAICQKPLAPDFAGARQVVEAAERHGARLLVHENFRFQPWHREIRRLIDTGDFGRVHTLTFRSRPGDGWPEDAYLTRQPYFRTMPRFLVHETGVHFIDVFRFLAGEIDEVYAVLRRLNPCIAGEDAGLLTFRFQSGAVGLWDANRCNESNFPDPRYTFGEFLVEGDGGAIRLYGDGRLTIQHLGRPETEHPYHHEHRGFGGDCVLAAQRHYVDCLSRGEWCETEGRDYLHTLAVVEAAYQSAEQGSPMAVKLHEHDQSSRHTPGAVRGYGARSAPATFLDQPTRVFDLSLPIDASLAGANVAEFKTLERDGWNATTLTLYSHCGTHMDAPRHFLPDGATLDRQSLEVCCGPARVLNLTPVAPGELLTVERLQPWAAAIRPGERLLLRTDWHKRFGEPAYRNDLPRIGSELARWLVAKRVALVGVEPPSVADVNNREELTLVHRILLGGGVTIVEGLANLDQLPADVVEFLALPLKIVGGDGCPVRAVARVAAPS